MTIISGHNRYVACCAFSRDGSLLATGTICSYVVTEIKKQYTRRTKKKLTFDVIAGSNDKSVIVWDLAGNLTVDSELSRNVGTKWFVNDSERVRKARLYWL